MTDAPVRQPPVVEWRPWPYSKFKPNCLFCPARAVTCAHVTSAGQAISIRSCAGCKALAEKLALQLATKP